MNDLTLKTSEGTLNIRVVAWIEKEGHLLVSIFPDGTISLPGGRLTFSETTLAGICREILEETGEALIEPKLWAIIENFFLHEQASYHEFLYIYRGTIAEQTHYARNSQEQSITWLSIEEIDTLKPTCLQKLRFADTTSLIHLINRD